VGAALTTGIHGSTDIDVLNACVLSRLLRDSPAKVRSFADAPVVFGEHCLQDQWNDEKAKEYATLTSHEFVYYYAQHFSHGELLADEDDNCLAFVPAKELKDYLGRLPLLPGMSVLVLENLVLAGKIVNGA